jgi:hypothetical protein
VELEQRERGLCGIGRQRREPRPPASLTAGREAGTQPPERGQAGPADDPRNQDLGEPHMLEPVAPRNADRRIVAERLELEPRARGQDRTK